MASRVMSLRFAPQQMERLERLARRLGRTPSETGALLVEESLRRAEFARVDFRDSAAGRQACLQGTSLAVWEVVLVGRSFAMDAEGTARHLSLPVMLVQAAFNYARGFPREIENALKDNEAYDFERLRRMVPETLVFVVPAADNPPVVP